MKKLLLISTMMVAAASAASADVALSGDARMGVTSADGGGTFSFSSRVRIKYTLSAENDGGVKFGATFRSADAANANLGLSGTTFVEIPNAGRLTMGDAEGAVQASVTQFTAIGYDDTGKRQELKFLTGGDTGKGTDALYTFTSGNLAVNLSAGNPGSGNGSGSTAGADDFAVGASYTTEFWKVAGGYEDNGVNSQTVLSGSYGNGQAEVKVAYGLRNDDAEQYVVYGTYIFGTNTLTGFIKRDFDGLDYHGVGLLHDFGSGLALSAGYATKEGSDALVNVGATMSF